MDLRDFSSIHIQVSTESMEDEEEPTTETDQNLMKALEILKRRDQREKAEGDQRLSLNEQSLEEGEDDGRLEIVDTGMMMDDDTFLADQTVRSPGKSGQTNDEVQAVQSHRTNNEPEVGQAARSPGEGDGHERPHSTMNSSSNISNSTSLISNAHGDEQQNDAIAKKDTVFVMFLSVSSILGKERHLEVIFSLIGPINSIRIISDNNAFVQFKQEEDAVGAFSLDGFFDPVMRCPVRVLPNLQTTITTPASSTDTDSQTCSTSLVDQNDPPPPGTDHGLQKTQNEETPKLPPSLWSQVGQDWRQRQPTDNFSSRRATAVDKDKNWSVKNMLLHPPESDRSLLYLPKTRCFVDSAPFCNYKNFKKNSDDEDSDTDSDTDGPLGRLAKKFAETNLTPYERMRKMLQRIERE